MATKDLSQKIKARWPRMLVSLACLAAVASLIKSSSDASWTSAATAASILACMACMVSCVSISGALSKLPVGFLGEGPGRQEAKIAALRREHDQRRAYTWI
jgi:peptidoglycan/LPS O-acetylase OafA/YrhL